MTTARVNMSPPDIRLPEDPSRQFEAHLFISWEQCACQFNVAHRFGQSCSYQPWASLANAADDSDLHPRLRPFAERTQHFRVGDLGIVDEKLLFWP
jgi:hypothetical protein